MVLIHLCFIVLYFNCRILSGLTLPLATVAICYRNPKVATKVTHWLKKGLDQPGSPLLLLLYDSCGLHSTALDASETTKPNVKWEDCMGLEKIKDALKESTDQPGKKCQGILLYGAPGTGKSLLVNAAVTGSKDSNFLSVSAYNLRSESMVESLFLLLIKRSPCIVYVDDLDALYDTDGSGHVTDGLLEAKAQFIDRMGELKSDSGVLVIGATNKPWRLNSDVIKVFQKRIYVPLPDAATRALIFQMNIQREPSIEEINDDEIRILSERTEGFTGADIMITVRDALMEPVRRIQTASHFKWVKGRSKNIQVAYVEDLLTPCFPDTPGAIQMNWAKVPEDKLLEPRVGMVDFLSSLQKQKPSVDQNELKRYEQLPDG